MRSVSIPTLVETKLVIRALEFFLLSNQLMIYSPFNNNNINNNISFMNHSFGSIITL